MPYTGIQPADIQKLNHIRDNKNVLTSPGGGSTVVYPPQMQMGMAPMMAQPAMMQPWQQMQMQVPQQQMQMQMPQQMYPQQMYPQAQTMIVPQSPIAGQSSPPGMQQQQQQQQPTSPGGFSASPGGSFCASCGARKAVDAKFCAGCGAVA